MSSNNIKIPENYEDIRTLIERMKDSVKCAICLEVLKYPVTIGCNHQFCRECIDSYIDCRKRRAICPLCKVKINMRNTTSCDKLQVMCEKVRELCWAVQMDTGEPISLSQQYPVDYVTVDNPDVDVSVSVGGDSELESLDTTTSDSNLVLGTDNNITNLEIMATVNSVFPDDVRSNTHILEIAQPAGSKDNDGSNVSDAYSELDTTELTSHKARPLAAIDTNSLDTCISQIAKKLNIADHDAHEDAVSILKEKAGNRILIDSQVSNVSNSVVNSSTASHKKPVYRQDPYSLFADPLTEDNPYDFPNSQKNVDTSGKAKQKCTTTKRAKKLKKSEQTRQTKRKGVSKTNRLYKRLREPSPSSSCTSDDYGPHIIIGGSNDSDQSDQENVIVDRRCTRSNSKRNQPTASQERRLDMIRSDIESAEDYDLNIESQRTDQDISEKRCNKRSIILESDDDSSVKSKCGERIAVPLKLSKSVRFIDAADVIDTECTTTTSTSSGGSVIEVPETMSLEMLVADEAQDMAMKDVENCHRIRISECQSDSVGVTGDVECENDPIDLQKEQSLSAQPPIQTCEEISACLTETNYDESTTDELVVSSSQPFDVHIHSSNNRNERLTNGCWDVESPAKVLEPVHEQSPTHVPFRYYASQPDLLALHRSKSDAGYIKDGHFNSPNKNWNNRSVNGRGEQSSDVVIVPECEPNTSSQSSMDKATPMPAQKSSVVKPTVREVAIQTSPPKVTNDNAPSAPDPKTDLQMCQPVSKQSVTDSRQSPVTKVSQEYGSDLISKYTPENIHIAHPTTVQITQRMVGMDLTQNKVYGAPMLDFPMDLSAAAEPSAPLNLSKQEEALITNEDIMQPQSQYPSIIDQDQIAYDDPNLIGETQIEDAVAGLGNDGFAAENYANAISFLNDVSGIDLGDVKELLEKPTERLSNAVVDGIKDLVKAMLLDTSQRHNKQSSVDVDDVNVENGDGDRDLLELLDAHKRSSSKKSHSGRRNARYAELPEEASAATEHLDVIEERPTRYPTCKRHLMVGAGSSKTCNVHDYIGHAGGGEQQQLWKNRMKGMAKDFSVRRKCLRLETVSPHKTPKSWSKRQLIPDWDSSVGKQSPQSDIDSSRSVENAKLNNKKPVISLHYDERRDNLLRQKSKPQKHALEFNDDIELGEHALQPDGKLFKAACNNIPCQPECTDNNDDNLQSKDAADNSQGSTASSSCATVVGPSQEERQTATPVSVKITLNNSTPESKAKDTMGADRNSDSGSYSPATTDTGTGDDSLPSVLGDSQPAVTGIKLKLSTTRGDSIPHGIVEDVQEVCVQSWQSSKCASVIPDSRLASSDGVENTAKSIEKYNRAPIDLSSGSESNLPLPRSKSNIDQKTDGNERKSVGPIHKTLEVAEVEEQRHSAVPSNPWTASKTAICEPPGLLHSTLEVKNDASLRTINRNVKQSVLVHCDGKNITATSNEITVKTVERSKGPPKGRQKLRMEHLPEQHSNILCKGNSKELSKTLSIKDRSKKRIVIPGAGLSEVDTCQSVSKALKDTHISKGKSDDHKSEKAKIASDVDKRQHDSLLQIITNECRSKVERRDGTQSYSIQHESINKFKEEEFKGQKGTYENIRVISHPRERINEKQNEVSITECSKQETVYNKHQHVDAENAKTEKATSELITIEVTCETNGNYASSTYESKKVTETITHNERPVQMPVDEVDEHEDKSLHLLHNVANSRVDTDKDVTDTAFVDVTINKSFSNERNNVDNAVEMSENQLQDQRVGKNQVEGKGHCAESNETELGANETSLDQDISHHSQNMNETEVFHGPKIVETSTASKDLQKTPFPDVPSEGITDIDCLIADVQWGDDTTTQLKNNGELHQLNDNDSILAKETEEFPDDDVNKCNHFPKSDSNEVIEETPSKSLHCNKSDGDSVPDKEALSKQVSLETAVREINRCGMSGTTDEMEMDDIMSSVNLDEMIVSSDNATAINTNKTGSTTRTETVSTAESVNTRSNDGSARGPAVSVIKEQPTESSVSSARATLGSSTTSANGTAGTFALGSSSQATAYQSDTSTVKAVVASSTCDNKTTASTNETNLSITGQQTTNSENGPSTSVINTESMDSNEEEIAVHELVEIDKQIEQMEMVLLDKVSTQDETLKALSAKAGSKRKSDSHDEDTTGSKRRSVEDDRAEQKQHRYSKETTEVGALEEMVSREVNRSHDDAGVDDMRDLAVLHTNGSLSEKLSDPEPSLLISHKQQPAGVSDGNISVFNDNGQKVEVNLTNGDRRSTEIPSSKSNAAEDSDDVAIKILKEFNVLTDSEELEYKHASTKDKEALTSTIEQNPDKARPHVSKLMREGQKDGSSSVSGIEICSTKNNGNMLLQQLKSSVTDEDILLVPETCVSPVASLSSSSSSATTSPTVKDKTTVASSKTTPTTTTVSTTTVSTDTGSGTADSSTATATTTTSASMSSAESDKSQPGRKMLLVVSRLEVKQFDVIKSFASMFKAKVDPTFSTNVTHVIINTDDKMICKRTLKYFYGIVARCWVVSFDWCVQSVKAGKLMDESVYEVRGDETNGRGGCRKARVEAQSQPVLLHNYDIIWPGPYCPQLPRADVVELLQLCGAHLHSSPNSLAHSNNPSRVALSLGYYNDKMPRDLSAKYRRRYDDIYQRFGIVTVSQDWLLDSIANYTVQAYNEYLLISNPSSWHHKQRQHNRLTATTTTAPHPQPLTNTTNKLALRK